MKLSDINIRAAYVLPYEGKDYLYGTRSASCWGKGPGGASVAGRVPLHLQPQYREPTQGLARSSNGEITGDFKQVKPLFMKDGRHGIVFRTKESKCLMILHSPNTYLEETPYFFEVIEADGRQIASPASAFPHGKVCFL